MPNIQNLICECVSCKEKFELNNTVLETREIKSFDDKLLYLTIIKCPLCADEIIVQIDDDETKQILKKQMSINYNLAVAKVNCQNKRIKKLQKKCEQFEALLLYLRKQLQLKYNGSVYYFQSEKKEIGLNVPAIEIAG